MFIIKTYQLTSIPPFFQSKIIFLGCSFLSLSFSSSTNSHLAIISQYLGCHQFVRIVIHSAVFKTGSLFIFYFFWVGLQWAGLAMSSIIITPKINCDYFLFQTIQWCHYLHILLHKIQPRDEVRPHWMEEAIRIRVALGPTYLTTILEAVIMETPWVTWRWPVRKEAGIAQSVFI